MLRAAKDAGAQITKTSIMLGCGERQEEVLETMQLLRHAGQAAAADAVLQWQLQVCAVSPVLGSVLAVNHFVLSLVVRWSALFRQLGRLHLPNMTAGA